MALSTGNVVITSPADDFAATDAGAVYLFNGATGALISTLRGSSGGDNIGNSGVMALGNGNYVVLRPGWDNGVVADAGAATFGSGTTGVAGTITTLNSSLGVTANSNLQGVVADDVNGTFFVRFLEGNSHVRVGSQVDGFPPPVNLSVSASAGTEAGTTAITVTATAPVIGDQTVTRAVTGAGSPRATSRCRAPPSPS